MEAREDFDDGGVSEGVRCGGGRVAWYGWGWTWDRGRQGRRLRRASKAAEWKRQDSEA